MDKNIQDISFACLPRETRNEIKEIYAYYFRQGDSPLTRNIDRFFGHHNLTSNTEPAEMLFVERKRVQEMNKRFLAYQKEPSLERDIDFYKGEQNALVLLFGDKCQPDKPSVQTEPKFKYDIGDLVTYRGKVKKIKHRYSGGGLIMYNVTLLNGQSPLTFKESDLEPYTEPETKDNMEEKELNLCELLSVGDLLESEFYSPAFGKVTLSEVRASEREVMIMDIASAVEYSLNPYGCLSSSPYGFCVLFPSRALYEKYPLDAKKAWEEWASERKPKYEVRSIIEYWEVGKSSKWASPYNIIVSSKEEAQQASEAVRECLKKFNEKNTQT